MKKHDNTKICLDYLIGNEERHYEECDKHDQQGHIYQYAKAALKEWENQPFPLFIADPCYTYEHAKHAAANKKDVPLPVNLKGWDSGGVADGEYTRQQFVELLRMNKNNPDAVQYLADMLEA